MRLLLIIMGVILTSKLNAMTMNNYICQLNADLHKNNLPSAAASINNYIYTGFASLECDHDNPLTVYLAIRPGKSLTNHPATVKSFNIKLKFPPLPSIVNIFQTYAVSIDKGNMILNFAGDKYLPPLQLISNITSDEILTDETQGKFFNELQSSELIIEQDQFFPDED